MSVVGEPKPISPEQVQEGRTALIDALLARAVPTRLIGWFGHVGYAARFREDAPFPHGHALLVGVALDFGCGFQIGCRHGSQHLRSGW